MVFVDMKSANSLNKFCKKNTNGTGPWMKVLSNSINYSHCGK